jgi:uroporphyrinogen decarboxylase
MTGRERLLAALSHREPDLVPLDLGGHQTGIHARAYRKLLDHLGLDEEVYVMDPVQQLARPSEPVLEHLRIDTRYVWAGMFAPRVGFREVKPGFWGFTDGFGVVWAMPGERPGEGLYCDIVEHPLADVPYEKLDDYPWPSGRHPEPLRGLRDHARRIREETPYALVSGISGVVFEVCWYLRGFKQFYLDMMSEPRYVEKLLDHTLEYWCEFLDGFLGEVGEFLDVLCIGDDIAMQTGPIFPPPLYRSLVKPYHRKLCAHVRERTGARIHYHSCGAVTEYLDDLIEIGVDIINPVQISARDMDPGALKRRFGERIVFWGGGVDTQHTFPHGTPDEVRREVARNLEAFKPGGGYVFTSVHNIQADVPIENLLAFWEAAWEAR